LAPEPARSVGAQTPARGALARLARARVLLRWEGGLAVALAAVLVYGGVASNQFFSSYNIFTLCTNLGDLALMSLPMLMIILTGEIDLSVASVAALSAEMMGFLWQRHWSLGVIFVICLAIGLFCGLFNGLLVTRIGLPSLAVTIGTLTLFRGLADVVLGSSIVSDFPSFWTNVGVKGFLGISWLSWSIALFVIFAVILGLVLWLTPFGRSLYAIGLNQEAAFYAGIRVKRTKLGLFALSGLVSAAVGILYAFELASAGEGIASGFELEVITIVLLGGVSIFGGQGTMLGVALAAFLYGALRSVLLIATPLNENDFQVVSGALLIIAVLIANLPALRARAAAVWSLARGAGATPKGPAAAGPASATATASGVDGG
jgi:rhamnose transport system permease protein